MEDDPTPSGEPIEEDLVKILPPDLLPSFLEEKARHREELKSIERTVKMARARVKKWFYGPVLEKKQEEVEVEYQQRRQAEMDQHTAWLAELKETIQGHVTPPERDQE